MQQRRGLKQDLPQPLRPGEFGFTVDQSATFTLVQIQNKHQHTTKPAYTRNTTGAVETANTIMSNQMIYVTVSF